MAEDKFTFKKPMERRPEVRPRKELEILERYHNHIYLGKVEGSAEGWAFSTSDIFSTDEFARRGAVEDLYGKLESLEATHITEPVIKSCGGVMVSAYTVTCEAYKIG